MLSHIGVDGSWAVGYGVVLGDLGKQGGGEALSPHQGHVHGAALPRRPHPAGPHHVIHCILGHAPVRGPLPTCNKASSGLPSSTVFRKDDIFGHSIVPGKASLIWPNPKPPVGQSQAARVDCRCLRLANEIDYRACLSRRNKTQASHNKHRGCPATLLLTAETRKRLEHTCDGEQAIWVSCHDVVPAGGFRVGGIGIRGQGSKTRPSAEDVRASHFDCEVLRNCVEDESDLVLVCLWPVCHWGASICRKKPVLSSACRPRRESAGWDPVPKPGVAACDECL